MDVFPLSYFQNHYSILKKTQAITRKKKGTCWRASELQGVSVASRTGDIVLASQSHYSTQVWEDAVEERCCKQNSDGWHKNSECCRTGGFATLGEHMTLLRTWLGWTLGHRDASVDLGLLIFPHFPRYQHHCFHVTSASGLGSGRPTACRSGGIF